MAIKSWKEIKQGGNDHYKTGQAEPIDLYLASGALRAFALCNIIKYAFRNIPEDKRIDIEDLDDIIQYAEMLKTAYCKEV
jgi:hypothetical protein